MRVSMRCVWCSAVAVSPGYVHIVWFAVGSRTS